VSGRAAAAADRLRIDAATAEVLKGFEAVGVESLLLKGPSLDAWLYPGGDRLSYLDADLLIGPRDHRAAGEALGSLGFEQRLNEAALPDWWREHGSEWWRIADGVLVDLHRSLPGLGVDAESAWCTLAAVTDSIVVAGYEARTLVLPARALLVALHAAHHGADGPKPLTDLERALKGGDDALWKSALALAQQLEATDAFAAGLRLTAAGEALADLLALPAGRSVEVALRASTAPPVALGFEQLARADGWRARAAIVAHKLAPPPEFIRHWSPRAAESRPQLVLAYMYRPFWVLRHSPRGLRAWIKARRQVHASRSEADDSR
jgi:hypothetical protein